MVADGIVPLSSGYDLATACALQAVGRRPQLPNLNHEKPVLLRFIPSRAGKVLSIRGFEKEPDCEGIFCEPLVKVGQKIRKAKTDGDRIAFILVKAKTIAQAYKKVKKQQKKIKIKIN